MTPDPRGRRVRAALENQYLPPSPGFDERMRSALHHAPVGSWRPRWGVEVAAAVLALLAILTLTLPKVLPTATHAPIAKPTPMPTVVPKEPVFSGGPPSLQLMSNGVAWFSAGQNVYRSTDGGAQWTNVSPPAESGVSEAAFALDSAHAWVAVPMTQTSQPWNAVTFYATGDGGRTWQRLGSFPIAGSWLHQITFVDSSHGWLLVSLGAATGSEAISVWGTTDGGHTWRELARSPMPQQAETPGQLSSACDKNGISFISDTTGWVTGVCAGGAPFLERTIDGGHTWQSQALPVAYGQSLEYSASVAPPIFADQSLGILPATMAIGPGVQPAIVLYVTRDGGRSWTATTPVRSGRVATSAGPGEWVVVAAPSQILFTRDGQRYEQFPSDTDLSQIVGVSFSDSHRGLALIFVTSGGFRLLRTADGGAHWSPVAVSS